MLGIYVCEIIKLNKLLVIKFLIKIILVFFSINYIFSCCMLIN